jgi:hypothetical protein
MPAPVSLARPEVELLRADSAGGKGASPDTGHRCGCIMPAALTLRVED